ncbi:unnamed protein product [Acanthoscelides obtectus]|uniref:Uncharacterized protein n=1 Tax=Acanthoscelides obtectus TaxID=200917 RepID=A0A9P0KXJ4_ACAOB|nr:unnamed protein product [Acanthoscelides obtectus]CAK1681423.1 hypothetical protein AOBTE_LOCUS33133 [Acanthoscelides obtectus]
MRASSIQCYVVRLSKIQTNVVYVHVSHLRSVNSPCSIMGITQHTWKQICSGCPNENGK